ncbi:hypothetical protein FB451DRAFT_609803 [Mycena latifolia]|nr:hypothetical protein FB451DRAFT_609803 [Mycena latifolia]
MPFLSLSKPPRVSENININFKRKNEVLECFYRTFSRRYCRTWHVSEYSPFGGTPRPTSPESVTFTLWPIRWAHRDLPAGPNAQRLARGLPPLPPTRLRVHSAKRATTSSTPPTVTCTSQTTVCCGSLEASTSTDAISVLQGLGLTPASANVGAMIGIACVVPVIVLGKKSCPTATAPASCCNTFLGLLGFSCTTTTVTAS